MDSSSWFSRQLRGIVVGAGSRGTKYASYALHHPERLKVVAVADPNKAARELMQKAHAIDKKYVHSDWQCIAAREKFADFVIIASPDKFHKDPAVSFAKSGYHILLEKPMAVSRQDCEEIARVCKENSIMMCVGHVLRYMPAMRKIKALIEGGVIGEIVNIQLLDPVGFGHFAHSFVRGNWRNEAESTFSLLSKGCHDIDLIMWWMGNKRCEKVSSFGALVHFKEENKPIGAGSRCIDCKVEDSCPYSAKKNYFEQGNRDLLLPICNLEEPTLQRITNALKSGPYGRCVYECDNDVCDNQVVNISFTGGTTANLTMIAYTERKGNRRVDVYGTKGQIQFDGYVLKWYNFLTGKTTEFDFPSAPGNSLLGNYGGAGHFMFESFMKAVATNDPSVILSGPDDSLASHLLVFAAERARTENRIVDACKELPTW